MSGHYCTEHKAVFFKKGNMKGYAHPIEGADPTKWCNEPEEGGDPIPEEVEAKPKPSPKPTPQAMETDTMTKDDWANKDRTQRISIQKQVAVKCATRLAEQKVITPEKVLIYSEVFARWLEGDITLKDPKAFDTMIAKYFIDEAQK